MKKANFYYLLRRGYFGGGGDLASTYQRLAEGAGYTIDSIDCVRSTFDHLKSTLIVAFDAATNYVALAEAASYTVDSFSCVRGTFVELENVAT